MPTTEIRAALCGSCGSSIDEPYPPTGCHHCGAEIDCGAPVALLRIAVHGLTITPRVEFAGRWDPERRRQIEQAIRQPNRPTLRAIAGGKL